MVRLACLLVAAGTGLPALAQQVVTTIATGPAPSAVALNPVTNKIYVASSSGNYVTVIDGATNATTKVAVGTGPNAIGVNTVTNKIYVTNNASNTMTVIDGATNSTSTVAIGMGPNAIAVNSATNKIYVSNTNSVDIIYGNVTVIDGATNTTTTIATNTFPAAIAVNPVTNKIFILDPYEGGSVLVVDGATNSLSATGTPGAYPSAIAVDSATNMVYVANLDGSAVSIIDGATDRYSSVGTGFQFVAIAVNATTNKIYAVNDDGNGSVMAIDGATRATSLIVTGRIPAAIAVNPVTNVIYVANLDAAGSVTVIDGFTNTSSTVYAGSYPFGVVVNPTTNRVYVACGDADGTVVVLDGVPSAVAPSITAAPRPQTVNFGSPVVFNAAANGRPSPGYAWSFNGAPLSDGNGISGSSSPTLFIYGGVTTANAGDYACTVTNSTGSVTSSAAALPVVSSADPGRIINLSTRAYVSEGLNAIPEALTAGFVIRGQGPKSLVLRGIGPALASFGLSDALQTPLLSLYDAGSPPSLITVDTGWQNAPTQPAASWSGKASPVDATSGDFAQVGAFGLPQGSADCAVKITLPAGGYTSQIAVASYANGVALAEIYDADAGGTGSQLVNVSSRGFVAAGDNILIAGFVISGTTADTVLIRASGPALAAFGVQATIADPQLQLFDGNQNLIASNLGWGGDSQIASAAARVGAFAWNDPTSEDSAILVTLAPGGYTAQVSSVSGYGGAALIEVYLVQ